MDTPTSRTQEVADTSRGREEELGVTFDLNTDTIVICKYDDPLHNVVLKMKLAKMVRSLIG